MIMNGTQRRSGERARAEILRDVAERLEAEEGGCLSARSRTSGPIVIWCVAQAY